MSSTLAFSHSSTLSIRRPRSPLSQCRLRFNLRAVTYVPTTRGKLSRRLSEYPRNDNRTDETNDDSSNPHQRPDLSNSARVTPTNIAPVESTSSASGIDNPLLQHRSPCAITSTASTESCIDPSQPQPAVRVSQNGTKFWEITTEGDTSDTQTRKQSIDDNQNDQIPPQVPLWPRALLLLVAAIFGTNFPVVKFLQSGTNPLDPSTAAVARFSLATLALIPPTVVELKRSDTPPVGVITAGALVGLPVFLGYFSQALSLDSTDAGKSAFLCSLAVVIVPILTKLFPKLQVKDDSEVPTSALATWGAPFLAVIGVALLELADVSPPNIGDFWGLVQALAFATGFMLNEWAARQHPGYSLTISAVQLSVVAAFAFIWNCVDVSMTSGTPMYPSVVDAFSTLPNGLGLLYTGLISTALTVVLSNTALSRVSAGELTVLLSTEPMWAVLFSTIVLNERMGSGTFVGAVFILAACIMNQADNLPIGSLFENSFGRFVSNPITSMSAVASRVQALINRLTHS